MTTPNSYRLPQSVRPTKYDITLKPNLSDFTFDGNELIEIEVSSPTNRISLNAIELEINYGKLTLADGSTVEANITLDETSETATFTFDKNIPQGNVTLSINFKGFLNDQLRGFYRSQYIGSDGNEYNMATTQFEATDARRAFPCWDEPSLKAKFQITLVVPQELEAISNTMIEHTSLVADGHKAVRFLESPLMSTYLVAFIVGDLVSVESMGPNNTLVRVWATSGKEEQGRYALENSVKLLEYFNEYFGIPYPLKKLDHIAIPDFAAGAMENWGAITYRETALLFDTENSSAATRQRILEVVSHEMAHMWFGDLVTMEWWNDLWLNESFASWMGDKAVDNLYPEWNMWTQFVSNDTNSGLGLDGLRNSHSIEVEVTNPAQIRELFDAISYSKGGATLRMLEEFLGPEIFRKGLQIYLSNNQYANARTEDLWKALEESSGQPVTTIMNSWVKQTGYPVIDVITNRASKASEIGITQTRFLYDHILEGGDSDNTLWHVPIGISIKNVDDNVFHLLSNVTGSLNVQIPEQEDWIKVNSGQTGFYRVNYPMEEWNRLRTAITKLEMPPTDRLGLQNDAYALMKAGYTNATQFLSIAESYVNENNATVWGDLSMNLRGFDLLLSDELFLDKYHSFVEKLYRDIVENVGWDAKPSEGHLDSLLRSIVLSQAGTFGNQNVISQAKAKFDEYISGHNPLHPDLRGLVYGLVAQYGNQNTYNTLWDLERKAGLHEEKIRLLGALSRFSSKDLLYDLLKQSMTDAVRSQDTVLVIGAVAGNQSGRDLCWDFIRTNWEELDRRYGRGGFAIMRLVSITGGFTTMERYNEVESFFKDNPAQSATRTIQQCLERIRLNSALLEKNRSDIGKWLSDK
jgi:puromycin-sensitive aminopeptidase